MFSCYWYAFLNLFLSLLVLLLAHWDTSKDLPSSFFLLLKRHLCLSLPHTDPFLAQLTHKGQTLFLVLLSLCIVNQLMPVSAPFTALGSLAKQHPELGELRSGRLCFANHLTRDDSTPRQAVLKWRGTIMKFPPFPGWKLQAARVDVRGSKTVEMPSVQAV